MQTSTQGAVCRKANDTSPVPFAKCGMANKRRNSDQPRHFLKEWREFRGLTQEELASRADTTKSVISLIEGHHRGLSQKWAAKFAPLLKTTPGALISYDPNKVDTGILELWLTIPDEQKPQAIRVLQTFRKAAG